MAILTIEQARSHCRVEPDYPADQLEVYMHAAESYVVAHLNRAVFQDESSLQDALEALPLNVGAAYDTYKVSLESAESIENEGQKQAVIRMAKARYRLSEINSERTMNGIVANKTIVAAMLLVLGNLFQNREADVVGASVMELPTGVQRMLASFRQVQMP